MSTESKKSKIGDLVPRMMAQGYTLEDVTFRRNWVEQKTGVSLPHIAY